MIRTMFARTALALSGCVGMMLGGAGAALAASEINVSSTAELMAAARQARPGSRIVMAPGRYAGNCVLSGLHGRPGALIDVAARDPGQPPVFVGGAITFQMSDCRYVRVDGLIATGSQDDLVHVGDGSHHIILRNVQARRVAGRGNIDGMKLPGLADFLISRCVVEDWGGGGSAIDMVGCARGLVAECLFSSPKPAGTDSNGVQVKGGSHSIGVFRCRFRDANFRAVQFGGLTGPDYFFQGNRGEGFEALDCAAIGNLFLGGEAALAFVSSTRCLAAYNTIERPGKYVARVLKEGGTRPTAGNTLRRNLIVSGALDEPLNVGSGVDLASFAVAENFWFNPADPARSVPRLPVAERAPAGGTDPKLDRAFRPGAGGPVADYGAFAPAVPDEWAAQARRFPWAWEQAQPFAPHHGR